MAYIGPIERAQNEFRRIVDECRENDSKIGYFAALYLGVTDMMIGPLRAPKKSDDGRMGQLGGFFDDHIRLEDFVDVFAGRFFTAYDDRDNLDPSHPWAVYFDYCEQPNTTILQILTLGANAHMNLDLTMAALHIAGPEHEDLLDLQGDFDRINQVLSWQIDACQQQVLDLSPVLRTVNVVPKVSAWLVGRLINHMRGHAWKHALAIQPNMAAKGGALGSAFTDASTEAELAGAVGHYGHTIVRPFLPIRLFFRLVSQFEEHDVSTVLDHLMGIDAADAIPDGGLEEFGAD